MQLTRTIACVTLAVFAFHTSLTHAKFADPIKEKLDQAKATYQTTLDKLNNNILDSLKKREQSARDAGQAKRIDATKAEREAYEKKGLIPPWLNPDDHSKAVRMARTTLLAAYDTAIKAYAKDSTHDAQRAIVMKERETLAAELAEGGVGSFRKGSVWIGTFALKGQKPLECMLEITKATDSEFEATFESKDGTTKNTFKGTIVRGKLEWSVSESRLNRRLSNAKGVGAVRGKVLEGSMESVYAGSKYAWSLSLKFDTGT